MKTTSIVLSFDISESIRCQALLVMPGQEIYVYSLLDYAFLEIDCHNGNLFGIDEKGMNFFEHKRIDFASY